MNTALILGYLIISTAYPSFDHCRLDTTDTDYVLLQMMYWNDAVRRTDHGRHPLTVRFLNVTAHLLPLTRKLILACVCTVIFQLGHLSKRV